MTATGAPRAMIYVQHLLGVGHLHRVAAIARALGRSGYDVLLVSGGMPDATLARLEKVRFAQLPAARAADATFRLLLDETGAPITDAWRAMRTAKLITLHDDFRPHVVLTELFPFGRRPMRFELLPLLQHMRGLAGRPAVLCSVRDILVDRTKPKRDLDSIAWLKSYYDGALIHGDPALISFDKTFPLAGEIRDLLHYTGYIVEQQDLVASPDGKGEVLVSAGGGAVGMPLFETAIAARPLSQARDLPWRLLLSQHESEAALQALQARAGPGVVVERARPDFPAMLRQCRLSISKAGYNTVMETLASRAHAVVVPFAGGEETEQALRAGLLAERGLMRMVRESELTPSSLAAAIDAALAQQLPERANVDMDGTANTVRLIDRFIGRA